MNDDIPVPLFIGRTTFPSRETAATAARALVEEGLAACAQIGSPVRSFYRWEGKLNEEEEHPLTVKYAAAKQDAVEKRLRELHPYTTPQWVAVRADRVSPDYLAWALGTDVSD